MKNLKIQTIQLNNSMVTIASTDTWEKALILFWDNYRKMKFSSTNIKRIRIYNSSINKVLLSETNPNKG